jgi:hypothetical protein
MRLECPHCQQLLDFRGRRPSFCSFCGQPLSKPDFDPDATLPPSPRVPGSGPGGAVGSMVGNYRLVRELGRGGMGVVWEAEETGTGRRVALKLLLQDRNPDAAALARFLREARSAAALSHPRTTFVFGAGEHAGQPYITMELMPGRTLADIAEEEGPLPVGQAVNYLLDVIDGLEAAHELGIVHRDVKPSNCFLDGEGRVKVGDFGLSKSLAAETVLTRTGSFIGTPLFAAPEQVRGGAVDARTDVYAVGATLFYLIAGRGPFQGDPAAVIAQIVSDPAPSLRRLCPAVPRDLDQAVSRTLQKDPEQRYDRLGQLRQALLPFASGGSSIADIGRRLSAYMIDVIVIGLVLGLGQITMGGFVGLIGGAEFVQTPAYARMLRIAHVVSWAFHVIYFALAEGWWGRGVGKFMLGLRVIGPGGEVPGLGRALLRALFVPGTLGVSLAAFLALESPGSARGPWVLLPVLASTFVSYIPLLLCLTTMRARNGYRGLHELASGTRVMRLRTAAAGPALPDVPRIAPVVLPDGARQFGPFRAVGLLGESGAVQVLLARDDVLQRPVWVEMVPAGSAPASAQRVALTRPARLRWLQDGTDNGHAWAAFEAVDGAPLTNAVRARGGLDWEHGRLVLLGLAEELAAAAADGTLPQPLTLEQVWIDRAGLVKLLDRPVRAPSAADPEPELAASAAEGAVDLMRAAVALCAREQVLPGHAQEFARELGARPAKAETLTWAAGRLRELSERPAQLRWDDRLGIYAVTAGTEYMFYWLTGLSISLLMWAFTDLPLEQRGLPTLALDLLLPTVLAFWLRGGPVFRFLGIEVRRSNGRPAGRLRCAWRSAVAWEPLLVCNAVLPLFILMGTPGSEIVRSPPSVLITAFFVSCGGSCVLLLALAGVVYGIIRPRRGVQDLLAGTCLVPR